MDEKVNGYTDIIRVVTDCGKKVFKCLLNWIKYFKRQIPELKYICFNPFLMRICNASKREKYLTLYLYEKDFTLLNKD